MEVHVGHSGELPGLFPAKHLNALFLYSPATDKQAQLPRHPDHCPPCFPHPPQTFLLWLATFNLNVVTSLLFITLSILFWLLAAANFNKGILKGAGGFGFFVAFLAYYGALPSRLHCPTTCRMPY